MMQGPGKTGEAARDLAAEGSDEALVDLELDERGADQVKGGGAPISEIPVTKQTDVPSQKL